MNKLYLYGFMLFLLAGFMSYFVHLISSKALLEEELQVEKVFTIALQENFKLQENLFSQATHRAVQANSKVKDTDDLFSRHDFQKLLSAKQNLIVQLVNSATVESNQLLECYTLNETARGGNSATCTYQAPAN